MTKHKNKNNLTTLLTPLSKISHVVLFEFYLVVFCSVK